MKITEREAQQEKGLLNTLKGSNDLHRELARAFNQKEKTKTMGLTKTLMSNTEKLMRQKN